MFTNCRINIIPVILFALFAAILSAAQPTPVPKGTLVIVGGNGMPDDIMEAFLAASGGAGARIGIIPTASATPDAALTSWKESLDKAGAVMVPLDVRSREDSDLASMLDAAKTCTGYWFSGGDQNRIADKIVGTPLQKIIAERYAEGACVGGTSAGAAIMSHIMITGVDLNGNSSLAEMGSGAYRTRKGMGFLPGHCIIDQHFLKRNRQNRLFSLMMEHPDKLGLGIDEATGLVVAGGVAKVLGRSSVMVFDPGDMKQDNSGGFQNMKIHLIGKGQSLDLNTRKVQ